MLNFPENSKKFNFYKWVFIEPLEKMQYPRKANCYKLLFPCVGGIVLLHFKKLPSKNQI